MTVVRMPEVATGTGSAAIQTWLVKAGDDVAAGQAIVEIETEKAVVDIEVDFSGTFAGSLVDEGKATEVGTPIAAIAVGGQSLEDALAEARADSATPSEPAADAKASAVAESDDSRETAPPLEHATPTADRTITHVPPAAPDTETGSGHGAGDGGRQFMSPLVRRLARDRGIDLTGVNGSGPNGRIVRRDLEALLAGSNESATAAPAAADGAGASAPAGPVEDPAPSTDAATYVDVPHTGMRRAIARRLSESKATVPHFYLSADCRMDELLALRGRLNEASDVRISVNDLVVKAVAGALMDVPQANATWSDDAIRQYAHADISVAVSIESGLITPVIRGVDRLSVSELSVAIQDVAQRARDGRLKQQEIEGGAFSVSNLGMYGVSEFSAIINPPQAGILAVGAASRKPVVADDGTLEVASVMTVTLSADHRVIDGAIAASWLAALTKRIENPLSIII